MSISWAPIQIGGPGRAYGPFTSGGGGGQATYKSGSTSMLNDSQIRQRKLQEQIAEEELNQRLNILRNGGGSGGGASNPSFNPASPAFPTSSGSTGSGSTGSGSTDYSSLITQQQSNQRELMGLANQYRLSEIGANTDSQSRIQREGSDQAIQRLNQDNANQIQRMGVDVENRSRLEREASGYRITEGIQATENSMRFEDRQASNRERLQRQVADQTMEIENNRIGQQIRLDNVNRSEARKLWRGV